VEDAETRELVEVEIREVLNQFEYNGDELPVSDFCEELENAKKT